MAVFRQPSFAGGEIDPKLWGRSDVERYDTALRTMRNFFASRHGAAVSRPGTTYCGVTKDAALRTCRLIPFVYSDTVSYVLEFGHHYVRFWQNGLQILSGGVPYEVATPYAYVDLFALKYAQQGGQLTLTHPGYPPAELQLTSTTPTFTYTAISFTPSSPIYTTPTIQEPVPTVDSTHPAIEWEWVVTELRRDTRGIIRESSPVKVTNQSIYFYQGWSASRTYALGTFVKALSGDNYRSLAANNLNHALSDPAWWVLDNSAEIVPAPRQLDNLPSPPMYAVYSDRPLTLDLRLFGSAPTTTDVLVARRVYKGRAGVWGWIDDTTLDFYTDRGSEPDFSQQPPTGTNPFNVYNPDGTLLRTEYPGAVTYSDGRRMFARTSSRPGFFWGSAVGDYYNFDTRLVPTVDEGFSFDLASRKLEQIQHLVGVGPRLLALTNSSAWTLNGDAALAYNSVEARVQTEVGANDVTPLVVDGTCLFCRTKGTGVRAVGYVHDRQGLGNQDMALLSEHLFLGKKVVDWCYQEDPWSVIWAVRSDGVLLSLTYCPEQQVWAWAHHDTNGTFESVCSVPEGQEDAVYAVVNRNGSRYVERFASRVTALTGQGLLCLDAAKVYGAGTHTTFTGLAHLNGMAVYAVLDGNVSGPYTVSGGSITVYDTSTFVAAGMVGLAYTPQLETLDLASKQAEIRTTQKLVTHVTFEVDSSRGVFVGPSLTGTLTEWDEREVSDSYSALSPETVQVRVAVGDGWSTAGRAALQVGPGVPVTVLGLAREVDIGGE